MSHYAIVEVEFNNKVFLIEALVNAGFARDQIEVHDEPQLLLNYQGEPTMIGASDPRFKTGDRAHVIIRREHVGRACNDYGIYIDAQHGSREFSCDWAQSNIRGCVFNPTVKSDGGFGPWATRLKREYAAVVGEQEFRDQGLIPERVDVGDNIYVYANC